MKKLLLCIFALLTALNACAETVVGDLEARYASIPSIEYEGKEYRMRSRLTTILLAGTDKRGGEEPAHDEYRNGGQADFLLLLVIDDNRDTVLPIQINRDTMTDITVLGVLGNETGRRQAQICLAHGFGDGAEQSCELLMQAVTGLMLDTPITNYAVMNLDGIAVLNDMLGGVEVTLEDDFTVYDPVMTAGSTLTLRGKQAEYYVRSRYEVGEQTNVSRMERQQTYMSAASGKLIERISANPNFIMSLFDALDAHMVTDMGRARILNTAKTAVQYEFLPAIEPEGELTLDDDGYVAFYPDKDSLTRLVLDAFYEPIR